MKKDFTKYTAKLRALDGDFDDVFIKDVGSLSKFIDKKKGRPETDIIVDYFDDDSYWYRLYKSGWIEQGGTFKATAATTTVTLLKEMDRLDYCVEGNYQSTTDNQYGQCYNLTTTNFTIKTYSAKTLNWQVKGFIKKG